MKEVNVKMFVQEQLLPISTPSDRQQKTSHSAPFRISAIFISSEYDAVELKKRAHQSTR